MRKRSVFSGMPIVILCLLVPALVSAQSLKITPLNIDSTELLDRSTQGNGGRATTSLEGRGAVLRLTYETSEPLTITMVPISKEGRYVPNDYLLLTLPATERGTAMIDLTGSPGWTPRNTRWLLRLLTKDENVNAAFLSVEFIPASSLTTVTAALQHFFLPEAYAANSYHSLRGYRVLSRDMAIVLGVLMVLSCVVVMIVVRKRRKLPAVVATLLLFSALYNLRFGLDLVRFSIEHLPGYARGLYDEAGSVYRIAPVIRRIADERMKASGDTTSVFVCRSGTNYKEKILRYFSYPVTVSADPAMISGSTLALVMNSDDWSTETRTEQNVTKQYLRCGDQRMPVEEVSNYQDGSILFTLTR